MGLSLDAEHLKRYTQLARLLVRYGRSDLVRQAGLDEVLDGMPAADPEAGAGPVPEAEALAADLEELGPTFVKLGQLLSTRSDLLPAAYTDALTRLQDDVEPFPFADVERIVEDELGVRISKGFSDLDPVPLAAASLGQVHRAVLRDGRPVAVKVQRPGIRVQVMDDLSALREIAALVDRHTEAGRRYAFQGVLVELQRSLLRELDYRMEATHLATLAANLAEFEEIVVPRPVEDYTTSRVLTMDYVPGRKITAVGPIARMEMDGERLAEALFRAYLKQILVDGFFHADPHPGNVFLTEDRRLALLDVGMVGRVTPGMQDQLLRLLLALSEGRGEEVADLMIRMGERLESFEEGAFERRLTELVIRFHDTSAGRLQIGRVMMEVTHSAAECGLRVPAQLTLLGKTLLNLDQVGRTLDPGFEPNAAVRRHAAELLRRRMVENLSPAGLVSSMLEMNEFVQRLPRRLNRVLDAVAESELEMRITVTNEAMMMSGLQKVANRIAVGLVLAALIIGAAMLMDVETSFRLLGYPGLAMLLFLGAVVGGVGLVIDVVRHDWRSRGPRA